MKKLELNQMETIEGGTTDSTKCRYGVMIGCGFVSLAFGLGTGPFGGVLAGAACKTGAIASGYCDPKPELDDGLIFPNTTPQLSL